MSQADVDITEQFLKAFQAGDVEPVFGMIHPECVFDEWPPAVCLRPGRPSAPISTAGRFRASLDGAVTGAPALDPVFTRLVLEAGGHLSVGIERTGRSGTPRSVDLVEQAAQLCRDCGRPPLTPSESRTALGLRPALH